jgi:hypothetical protein
MNIPSSIRAGTTVTWREDSLVDPYGNSLQSTDSWVLKFYIRTNSASGLTATGSTYTTGWQFDLSASDTAPLTKGDYFWQAICSKGATEYSVGTGALEVLQSLAYTGSVSSIQEKSQVQQDLEAVDSAIRTLIAGGVVKEYSIGDRSLKKYDLAELRALQSRLTFRLKREQKPHLIKNGLGNPDAMYVSFR